MDLAEVCREAKQQECKSLPLDPWDGTEHSNTPPEIKGRLATVIQAKELGGDHRGKKAGGFNECTF